MPTVNPKNARYDICTVKNMKILGGFCLTVCILTLIFYDTEFIKTFRGNSKTILAAYDNKALINQYLYEQEESNNNSSLIILHGKDPGWFDLELRVSGARDMTPTFFDPYIDYLKGFYNINHKHQPN